LILKAFFLSQRNDDEDDYKTGFESELAAFDDDIEDGMNVQSEIGIYYY
jgi:hypothetical protein